MSTGHDVNYYTDEVAAGREGYYTGAVAAGEPPGVWYGAGAELLGLSGEVDAEQLKAIYHGLRDPRDPQQETLLGRAHKNFRTADEIYEQKLAAEPGAGPERRAELRAEAQRAQRQPVAFIDVTFNAPKSVSVLGVAFERAAVEARAAGDERAARAWEAHARAVEEAVLAGARAGIDYLQRHGGFARTGHHGGGAGRWIDTEGLTVAQFFQHDSRNRDPHWHVHQLLLNRVLCADGVWRALDGQAIFALKAAASAVSARVCEAYLTRAFGAEAVARADGHGREIAGVDQRLMDWFSSRRRAIGPKAQQLVAAFVDRYRREPSALERDKLAQQATLLTRPAKSHHGETAGQRMDRWQRETLNMVKGGLAQVARTVLTRAQRARPPDTWSEQDVIERALAEVAESKQAWTRSDLLGKISDALPGHIGIAPEAVPELLDGLTDTALAQAVRLTPPEPTDDLPGHLLRADGSSAYANPSAVRYATREQLAGETWLRDAAVARGAATLTDEQADTALARLADHGLLPGLDQAAAIRGVATSGARVETLCAAAGSGKSVTVAALSDVWASAGRRAFGLAPSQVAADVLADDGLAARNLDAWLALQARLDRPGQPHPDDAAWRLADGDLVIVDEAGMADTADLVAVAERCEAAGAKLLLAGDPRQLAAVGAGGAFADLAGHGLRYELSEVRRFDADWERSSSLGLREGDTAALDDYQRHGRLVDGGTAEQAETCAQRAWLADTLAGRDSLLLVGTNEAAARMSAALRADLVALRWVDEDGVTLGREGWQGTIAGVGDLVQTRRNGWELLGWEGNTRAPVNRATYRVTALRDDGGLTVAPITGRDTTAEGGVSERLGAPVQLPASYVTADLTLGYASTVHAAQGRTVDTGHAVIAPGADAGGTYVAMTRGRDRNTAHVVTRDVADNAPAGSERTVAERSARAVLADVIERDPAAPDGAASALAQQTHAAETARSVQTSLDRLDTEIGEQIAGRTGALLDWLTAEEALTDAQRQAVAADGAYGALDRLLRTAELAGHDPRRVLATTVAERDLDSARYPARVLHSRISDQLRGKLTPQLSSYADLIPATVSGERRQRLERLAADADDRRRELGAATAEALPQWAREALGPVQADPIAAAEWEHAAGWAAAHRELTGHDDQTDPLGPAPPAGLADKHASWHTAHAALGLTDGGGDEDECSTGRLRARVRAYERECHWAPRYVADELDTTSQDAEQARVDAQLCAARAQASDDQAERDQLAADADDAHARAEQLAQRAAELEQADQARGAWYAHTATTRDAADRAAGVLAARGVDLDAEEQTTGDEWLAAHRADQAAEDPHRVIDEAAVVNDDHSDATPAAEAEPASARVPELAAETAVLDIRDTTTPDPAEYADPALPRRASTADETAASVARAQAALAEIEARQFADAERDAHDAAHRDGRREELARWAEQTADLDEQADDDAATY